MPDHDSALRLIIWAIAIAVGLGAIYIAITVQEQQQLKRRVSRVMVNKSAALDFEQALFVAAPQRRAEQILVRLVPSLEKFRETIRQARLNINIGIYIFVIGTISIIAPFLINFSPIPSILAPIVVIIGIHLFFQILVLRYLMNRTRGQMIEQMPSAIDMISRSLRVGQGLDNALSSCAIELEMPLKRDFDQIVARIGVGTPLAEAVDGVAYEAGIREFEYFATACRVQLESGGNLADALASLSETIRARLTMRLKIKALAAEGKMSAWVIGCLPFILLTYFHFVSPDYIAPLFDNSIGQGIFSVSMVLIFIGVIVMARMIRIKI